MAASKFYDSKEWAAIRLLILRRDNYTCRRCKTKALGKRRNGVSPVVDHIKPRPKYANQVTAADQPGNLQVLCKTCHDKKTVFEDNNTRKETGNDGYPIDSPWGTR